MQFFVPGEPGVDQEARYAALAKLAGYAVPEPAKRIARIQWTHEREEWTAVVGEQLTGSRRSTRRSKGRLIQSTAPVSDSAVVLAIFDGPQSVKVVTDARPLSAKASKWENPLMAGVPEEVEYFSAPDTEQV